MLFFYYSVSVKCTYVYIYEKKSRKKGKEEKNRVENIHAKRKAKEQSYLFAKKDYSTRTQMRDKKKKKFPPVYFLSSNGRVHLSLYHTLH